jgi:uncharacterized membrane protein
LYNSRRLLSISDSVKLNTLEGSMENVLIYFLVGFMTAFGWWAAGKVTTQIDSHIEEQHNGSDLGTGD